MSTNPKESTPKDASEAMISENKQSIDRSIRALIVVLIAAVTLVKHVAHMAAFAGRLTGTLLADLRHDVDVAINSWRPIVKELKEWRTMFRARRAKDE